MLHAYIPVVNYNHMVLLQMSVLQIFVSFFKQDNLPYPPLHKLHYMLPLVWQSHRDKNGVEDKKTSPTQHVSICFETCIAVTRNIEWEVTLACSALQAPSTVRINPETQPTLQRILAGAAKEENKYPQINSVLERSHVPFDQLRHSKAHF